MRDVAETLPLDADSWFKFRFAADRLIPRFHTEGVASLGLYD